MAEKLPSELFLSFRKPKTNVYIPGETVAGSAFFAPQFNARLRSLTISLKGYSYTSSLGANAKVSHVVPFFHLATATLADTYTYSGERYEAPFAFMFPEETKVVHAAGPQRLRVLFQQGPQVLPSSAVISTRNCVQIVRYFVEVELHGRKQAAHEETVLFRQTSTKLLEEEQEQEAEVLRQQEQEAAGRLSVHLDTDEWTSPLLADSWHSTKAMYYHRPSTIRLSDKIGAPKLSLHALPMITTHHKSGLQRYQHVNQHNKSTLISLFRPWKQPKVVFMPSIYCPQTIAVGQEIPLLLAVDTIKNPMWAGGSEDEQLILESFSLAVTAHTRTIMQNRPHKRRWGRCLELSYAVIQANGLNTPISIEGDPLQLLQNFRILPGAIPSFSTYTIARGYSVDVFFKFRYETEHLEWGASINLNIAPNAAIPHAPGENMDPLLFVDPRREPQYFWRSRIEAGAAESTARSDIYPDDPRDSVNMPGKQWDTGHGRLPRTSYACASAQVRPELTPVQGAVGRKGAFSVIAGVSGRPYRRYIKDLEPMVKPLWTFRHGLGLDGTESVRHGSGLLVSVDGCGVMKSLGRRSRRCESHD